MAKQFLDGLEVFAIGFDQGSKSCAVECAIRRVQHRLKNCALEDDIVSTRLPD